MASPRESMKAFPVALGRLTAARAWQNEGTPTARFAMQFEQVLPTPARPSGKTTERMDLPQARDRRPRLRPEELERRSPPLPRPSSMPVYHTTIRLPDKQDKTSLQSPATRQYSLGHGTTRKSPSRNSRGTEN